MIFYGLNNGTPLLFFQFPNVHSKFYDYRKPVGKGWPKKSRLEYHGGVFEEGEVIPEYQKCDHPGVIHSTFPIVSGRAKKVLEPLVNKSVIFLPLLCEQDEFWAMNVIDVVDGLDRERTIFEKFDDGYENILKPAYSSALLGHHCFFVDEIPELIFVSAEFARLTHEHGLSGFSGFEIVRVDEGDKPDEDLNIPGWISRSAKDDPYEGLTPHHIIPTDEPEAQEARDLLDRYQIDINSSENGMWLPTELHELETFYSAPACAWMTQQLLQVEHEGLRKKLPWGEIRELVIQELTNVGQHILDGDLPWEQR